MDLSKLMFCVYLYPDGRVHWAELTNDLEESMARHKPTPIREHDPEGLKRIIEEVNQERQELRLVVCPVEDEFLNSFQEVVHQLKRGADLLVALSTEGLIGEFFLTEKLGIHPEMVKSEHRYFELWLLFGKIFTAGFEAGRRDGVKK